MAEAHGKRQRPSQSEIWKRAYEIASSSVVSTQQERLFKDLLQNIKDIDSVPPEYIEGRCPLLQQAAGKGHLNLIKLLLEAGANINYRFHSYKFTALRSACRFAQLAAFNMLVEHGCNLNAEDIGHVPINHAIHSGNVPMVEAVLAHDVSLCLPEILQEAILQCQIRERELNSYRTSGVVPTPLLERQKREAMQANGSDPNSPTAAPGSTRFGATSPTEAATPQSPSQTPQNIDKILSDDFENRILIVLMLLQANIRLPLNTKPQWLPYLRSHTSFKSTVDTILGSSSHTFDRIRNLEFANMTTVELVGECIDDERASVIARLLIATPSTRTPLLHLNLSRNWIEQRGATEIGNALSRNSTLLTLNLGHNFIQDCTHMMKGMKDNRTLKTLDLSANRLATAAGEAIAMRLPTLRLTTLNLAMNKLEHRGGMQVLRAVLCNETLTVEEKAETEHLAFNSSGRAMTLGVADVAAPSSSQVTIDSTAARRSSSGNIATENAPVSTLTSLNLSSNEIHPYEKNLFSDELTARLTTNMVLKNLDLSYNWIGTGDLLQLVRALAHNIQLTSLSIKGYTLTEDNLKQMLAAISLNFSLKTFEFHALPSPTCDAIRRHVFKNSINFCNSHTVQDPIAPDVIEPGSPSTPVSTTPPTSGSPAPPSPPQEESKHDASNSEPGNDEIEERSGMAPTKATITKSRTESLASVPKVSYGSILTTKQYGIVKKGENQADTTDYLSIPFLDENMLTPAPQGNVTEVHAGGRDFNCFPTCILQFDSLTKLVLQHNNLASLPRSIGCLKGLIVLDVRHNRLPALPPEIGDLPKLTFLLASYNKLQFVPVQMTKQASLKYVLLHPNPLTLLPPGFRKSLPQLWKKSFQESELYQYLKTISACGEGTFNKGRLMLVGDPAVGKTTIRKMLVRGKSGFSLFGWLQNRTPAQEVSVATDGIDIDVVKMSDRDGKKYTFDVWDYAGHEVYYTTHTFFLSPRAVYLLVFNMENYSRLSIEYWMQSIVFKAGTDAPIFLVGTHPEKLSPPERTALLAQLKSNYRGVFVDLVWINPVTGEGVDELKQKVCKIASQRKLVGETVPKSYMRIADQLLATAQTRPYMPLKEIAGIVLSNDVPHESIDAAISWLIDIGAVLSYSPNRSPEQIVFIDPQFLCNTFSQVVSIKYSSTTGRLSRGVIASICKQDLRLQAELFRILRSFDLAYVLKRAQDDVKYESASALDQDIELFVPALLADAEPADLFTVHWKPNPTMRVYQRHFTFPFLPLGFFSKLLVRCLLLPGVEPLCYWSNGIVAKKVGLTGSPAFPSAEVDPSSLDSDQGNADTVESDSHVLEERFFLKFEPEKNLLTMQVNADQDGVTLALLVDLVGALISERYPQAEFTTTIPVSTSCYETVYLNVDELASNIACGQYVKVVEGKVWNISMFAPDLVLRDLSNLRIDEADIEKGRRLGVGSFGEVFEATYHGEQCAVKYITRFKELANESDFFRTRSSDFANFAHEIRIMNLLRHPNIVRMKGFIPRPVGLLMEFFACGDLVGLLEKTPDTPWPLRVRIALDIALGMEYLHMLEPPLCHRDLRSPNILLKSRQADSPEPVAKVADFGLTVAVVDRLGYGPTESWRWSAPEVVTSEQYTHRSDIWSFGILLLELIYAELPYQSLQKSMGKREDEMSRLYAQGAFRPEFPTSFEQHLVPPSTEKEHQALKMLAQIGRECCSEAPDDRPTFSTIKSKIFEIVDSMDTLQLPDSIKNDSQLPYAYNDEEDDAVNGQETDETGSEANRSSLSSTTSSLPSSAATPIESGTPTLRTSLTIPQKVVGYKLNEKKRISLTGKKTHSPFMTTAARVVGQTVWLGLADGTLGCWDVSVLMPSDLGKGTPDSVKVEGDSVTISPTRLVGDHMFSIRGIVANETSTKICAISEDGYFTIVNLKDFTTKKFQASPAHTSPLLSICTIGERIYIGNARGHVVAWSWETPTLLAFWDGMDRQPVCQLFYTRGTRDLVVTYGQSIKFLNIFDLGDTLRHWKPQMKSEAAPDTDKISALKTHNVSSGDLRHVSTHPPALIAQEHHRLTSSSKAVPTSNNEKLFKNVSDCQHSAFIGAAGNFVWTKSGPIVRLWNWQKSRASITSSNLSLSSSEMRDSGDRTKDAGPASPSARKNAFLSSITLHKELTSPNSEACSRKLVAPTILSSQEFVFILESPTHVTLWDIPSTSYFANLPHPSENPRIENIFLLGDTLVAIARDRLFIWRPEHSVPSNVSSSTSAPNGTEHPPAIPTSNPPELDVHP